MAESPPHDPLLQVHRRLDLHETRLQTVETRQAVAAVQAENIQKSLEEIRGDQRWLIRLVAAAIIGAILTFMVRGGFHVG